LNCETDGTDVETNFYNYVSGRFKYIFLKVCEIWNLYFKFFSMMQICGNFQTIWNKNYFLRQQLAQGFVKFLNNLLLCAVDFDLGLIKYFLSVTHLNSSLFW